MKTLLFAMVTGILLGLTGCCVFGGGRDGGRNDQGESHNSSHDGSHNGHR